jgi:hypothetical protein
MIGGFVTESRRVSVVVTVPYQDEPWKVSGAAFRLLVSEVQALTPDSEFMVRAAALSGLHLGMATPSERQREAGLLAEAARNLRARLLASPAPDEWERSLADYLPVLEMWMDGLVSERLTPDHRHDRAQPAA